MAKQIRGLRRLEGTGRRIPIVGDNWHTTQLTDGRQLTSLCDGNGAPEIEGLSGDYYNSRVLEILGSPPDVKFRDLPNFPDLITSRPPAISRYYGFGIIAVDGHVYHFMSTPNHPFTEPEPRFVGAKLIHSPDGGNTWQNQHGGPVAWEPWGTRNRENMAFFYEPGDAFSLLTVLQMGRNYELNRDGYIYVYAPNGNVEGTMNQLVMFRVPKDKMLDRGAYEYFASIDQADNASWTSDIKQRGIVHTFPRGWVNTDIHPYAWHPSVVYNPAWDLYMMVNWGMGCNAEGEWFGKPSYLGFWTAPQPWGPWTQVHEDTEWMPLDDKGARAYQPQIIPGWMSEDGKSFWMVWTDFQLLAERRPYYCFNYQQVAVDID